VRPLPPLAEIPQPGEAAHVLMMMRNMALHAGDVMWAKMIREGADFFDELVRVNNLEKWRKGNAP
jgi:hypothetical protein